MTSGTRLASGVRAVVDTRRMPHTTQFRRLQRGVEELYYFHLFATDQRYAGNPEVWQLWVDTGFSTGLQDAPPGVLAGDRIHVSMRTDGKRVTLTATAGQPEATSWLAELLERVESLRPTVDGLDHAARIRALTTDDGIASDLVDPVRAAVEDAGLRPDEVVTFGSALERDLVALVHPDIVDVQVERT